MQIKLCYWLKKKRYYRAGIVDYEEVEEEEIRLTELAASLIVFHRNLL
jgi:hypothetical protein